jgi:hypothetical protein
VTHLGYLHYHLRGHVFKESCFEGLQILINIVWLIAAIVPLMLTMLVKVRATPGHYLAAQVEGDLSGFRNICKQCPQKSDMPNTRTSPAHARYGSEVHTTFSQYLACEVQGDLSDSWTVSKQCPLHSHAQPATMN